MFVRELEEWAAGEGRKAALAFTPIAASDPMGGMRWVAGISEGVSAGSRKWPDLGLYAIYMDASHAARDACLIVKGV